MALNMKNTNHGHKCNWGEQCAEFRRFHKMGMRAEGYEHVKANGDGTHILRELSTGRLEIWANSKGYAGYTLPYKNTELEFCASV